MTTVDFGALMQAAGQGFQPVPNGPYNVQVTKATATQTSTQKPMIKVQLAILGGPHDGRKLFDQFVISAENPNALSFFFEHMAAFGLTSTYFAANPALEQVAADLMNRQAAVTVSTGSYKGRARNEIDSYSPIGGGVVGAPAAAPGFGPGAVPQAAPVPVAPQIPQAASAPAPVPAAPAPVPQAPAPVAAPTPAPAPAPAAPAPIPEPPAAIAPAAPAPAAPVPAPVAPAAPAAAPAPAPVPVQEVPQAPAPAQAPPVAAPAPAIPPAPGQYNPGDEEPF